MSRGDWLETQTNPSSSWPFFCLEYMRLSSLFSFLKLFLRSPAKRFQGSPRRPEGGQDPEGGKRKKGPLGGKTVLRKNHLSTGQAKPVSLTSWAFVELIVWNGHSAWGSRAPSNAVALSECSPPGVENGLGGETFPCRVAWAATSDWDKGTSICAC